MANKDSKNFVDTIVEAQKQMVDTVAEQSKKFANGNNAMKETVEKGSEWYKNWLEGQNNIFSTAKEKAATMTDKTQAGTDKMNEYYQNWMNSQMEMAKNMWDMNMNQMKNNTPNMATNNDPMAMWNNMTNNWNNWMKNMNQTSQWNDMINKFQSANPFAKNTNPFSADAFKKVSEDWTGMFNQYYEMLNSSFSNMQKDIQNGTTQDAFRNMVNVSEAFTRFSEMWTPFMKSIQDKTFNTEMFKEYANPAMYKDMMDKYFGFMPEQNREYMQNVTNMMQENFAKMNQGNIAGYNQMRDMMGNMMPAQSDIFGTMLNNHNSFTKMMSDASAPFMKMMGSDKNTKAIAEWSDIANRMAVYNIKNAEMQYMVYNQGAKVMNNLADYIAKKVESGEEITSMMTVYQEWLNIGDKTFVELFESEEYSKMMAEVNAMQLTLRKDVEKQLEKAMTGIPVATRSEMDEIYKTIYDLKKQVRELEKVTVENIANDTPVEKATTAKTTAAKTTTAAKSTTASRAKK